MVLNHEDLGFAVRQQLQVFRRRELVVQGHQDTTTVENGVGRNQPFRLVGHDDRGAIVRVKFRVFESAGQRQGDLFKIRISQAKFFTVAFCLDQADFGRIAVEGIAQGSAETRILSEIKHPGFISTQRRYNTEEN